MTIDPAILQFTWLVAALVISPGPTLAVVLRNALADGWHGGVATALGIGAGNTIQAVVAALGLAALLQQFPSLRQAFDVAGGLYLLWLGIGGLRRASAPAPLVLSSGPDAAGRRGFRQGLLTNLLHPAVTVFYVTAVPAFISPGVPMLQRFALLSAIHVVVSTGWMTTCALLVGRVADLLRRPLVSRLLQAGSGAALVAFGITALARR